MHLASMPIQKSLAIPFCSSWENCIHAAVSICHCIILPKFHIHSLMLHRQASQPPPPPPPCLDQHMIMLTLVQLCMFLFYQHFVPHAVVCCLCPGHYAVENTLMQLACSEVYTNRKEYCLSFPTVVV